MINYIPRRFTVIRDKELCINCGCCVRQCSNECHFFDEDGKTVLVNSKNCVACHRCVDLCPTGALRIEKYVCDYRDNANWTPSYQQEICRQAETGSVLLSAMGNPKPYPIYWDKILLNASQVTNPSIDPLREPMEIRTILGRKPDKIEVEKKGKSITEMPPQVRLETPIMFSAMSFGSISLNAQKSLAMAAVELGTLFNTGEGGLHPDLRSFGDYAVVQVASGRFGVHKDYLNNSKFVEIKIGQATKPGMGGLLPGDKVTPEIAKVRGKKAGEDIISPSRFPNINSKKDLKDLVDELRLKSEGRPIGIKIAAGYIENDLEFINYAKPDFITVDGRGGATGASPLLVRDSTSIPTIFALHRARKYLDEHDLDIDLVITGGLRVSSDFAKALAMGADAIAIASASLIPVACQQHRLCDKGQCPVGVATQDKELRSRLKTDIGAKRLTNYLNASLEEIKTFARITGHSDIHDLNVSNLATFNSEISDYTNIKHV